MSRVAFNSLLDLITPFLHNTKEEMRRKSSSSFISNETKLYTMLRWLAGGSFINICFAWGISKASFFSTDLSKGIIWPVMEAIAIVFEIGLPTDHESLSIMADEFKTYSHGELSGCVTAIDG
jgi:hypothetical protein